MTTVREAHSGDATAIAHLETALFGSAGWSAVAVAAEVEGASDTRLAIVAEEEGAVCGYAFAVLAGDTADVLRIGVCPQRQRRGVGASLLARLLEWAETRGCKQVLLEVSAENRPAQQLYATRGFSEISRRPRYYSDDADAVVMRRPLLGVT